METVVHTEGEIRTVETVSSRVVTNKTIVQRTANTNSTHVNRYDAEGNLKSSEIDSKSWEDRDTKSFEWSDPSDQPPTSNGDGGTSTSQAVGEQLSVEKLLKEEPTPTEPGQTLVMTTTDLVPGVRWSGTSVEQSQSTVVSTTEGDGTATDVQINQRTTTNMAGESWSRSGEAVWITETTNKSTTSPTTPLAIENAVSVPVLVDEFSTSSSAAVVTCSTECLGSTDVPLNSVSSVTNNVEQPTPPPPTPLSVDERRQRRCAENRARKAAGHDSAYVTQPSTA